MDTLQFHPLLIAGSNYLDIAFCLIIAGTLFFYRRDENSKHDTVASIAALLITIGCVAEILRLLKTGECPRLDRLAIDGAFAVLLLRTHGNIKKAARLAITSNGALRKNKEPSNVRKAA
jgi:hypothetical protein